MRSSKSSPAGNSSICTASVANSWIRASAAFRPVLRSTRTYRPCENVPKRVLGAGVPQIIHFGARTGFVHELQMSQRQTWLVRRDMAVGQPGAVGAKPGLSLVHAVVEGRPAYVVLGLHRGCARGAGQRAPVCRCAATRRSKQEIDPSEVVQGATRVGRPSHMTRGPSDPASAVRH